jgi:hypothetical protein
MAIALLIGVPLLSLAAIGVLRRSATNAARVDAAFRYFNGAFLIGLEELLALTASLSAPMGNFLEKKLRVESRVEQGLEEFAKLFGSNLERGDALMVARRMAPPQSVPLLDADLPEDILPSSRDLRAVLDRLVPERTKLARVEPDRLRVCVVISVRTFVVCTATMFVCYLVAATFVKFPANLGLLAGGALAGVLLSSGLSILSFVAAVNAQMLLDAIKVIPCERRVAADRHVRDLQHAVDFADSRPGSSPINVGTCRKILTKQGAALPCGEGRQAVFDRETFARGVMVYSGTARQDAAEFAAEVALNWAKAAGVGVIAIDLTGELTRPLLSSAAGRRMEVHRVGLKSDEVGLNLAAFLAGGQLESLCSSVIAPVKGDDVAALAGKAVRSMLVLGPLYQLSRRIELRDVPPDEDASSLAWAMRSLLGNDVKTVIDRIEHRREDDRRKIDFAADLGASEDLSRLYQERYTSEIAESVEFLRSRWIASSKKQIKDARAALKVCFSGVLRNGAAISRFLVPATADSAHLEASCQGRIVAINLPTKSEPFLGALCCLAIGELFDSLNGAEKMPLLVLHGAGQLQSMGKSSALEFLRILAERRVPRLFVTETVTELDKSLGSVAQKLCASQESKAYFRSSDSRTNAQASVGIYVADDLADDVTMHDVGSIEVSRLGRALRSSAEAVLQNDAHSGSSTDAPASKLTDAGRVPLELETLMPGCAFMHWIRCGLVRAAVVKSAPRFWQGSRENSAEKPQM